VTANIALPVGVNVTPTALVLPKGMTEAEWLAVGQWLLQEEQSLRWAVGDWWRYGEHAYGDRKALATATEAFGRGYAFQTLMAFGHVAGAVPTFRRRKVLSWSHHAEVAKLGPEDQERFLEIAVAEKLSVKKLRDRISEATFKPSTEDDHHRTYLDQLMKAAQINKWLTSPVPWENRFLEDYLARHLQQNDLLFSKDFADLIKAAENHAAFWDKTGEFLRRLQSNVRANERRAA
jgi:hypothetical protein